MPIVDVFDVSDLALALFETVGYGRQTGRFRKVQKSFWLTQFGAKINPRKAERKTDWPIHTRKKLGKENGKNRPALLLSLTGDASIYIYNLTTITYQLSRVGSSKWGRRKIDIV